MRHQKSGRKLNRNSSHRKAMFSNMTASLLMHERIETTEAKAKELRKYVERAIAWGTRVGDLLAKDRKSLSGAERAKVVHAMRMAKRVVKQDDALTKLFHDVAPRYRGRPGGFTRVLKTRTRTGDAAKMAYIELVGQTVKGPAAVAAKPKAKPAGKTAESKKVDGAESKATSKKADSKKAESKATSKKADSKKAESKAKSKKAESKATSKKADSKKAPAKKAGAKAEAKKPATKKAATKKPVAKKAPTKKK